MAVSLTLSPTEYDLYQLGGIATATNTGTSIRGLTAVKLGNGRIALEWTNDVSGGTDRLFAGVFDTVAGTFNDFTPGGTNILTSVPAAIGQGVGNQLLLLNVNSGGPVQAGQTRVFVQRIDQNGVAQGTAIPVSGAAAVNTAEPLRNGGFAVLTSDNFSSAHTAMLDLRIIGANGAVTRTIENVLPWINAGNGSATNPRIAELADGGIVVAWSLGGTSGAGINLRIWNADGSARTDVVSVYTGVANFQTWRAGQVELAGTPDGGFYLGRSVDFQKFNALGQEASGRGVKGGTHIDTLEGLPDGNMLFFTEGTLPGKILAVMQPNAVNNTVVLQQQTQVVFQPYVNNSSTRPEDAVVQMDDGSLFVFTPISSTNSNGVHSGATINVRKIAYSGNPVAATAGNDTVTGTSLADLLAAFAGNDTILGLGGNDTLDGGPGADLLDGGPGFDIATYALAVRAITARLDLGFVDEGGGVYDTLQSIEGIIGSIFNDVLVAAGGIASRLEGGAGNDTIYGSNLDTVIGGSGIDTFFGGGGGALNLNLATAQLETVWGSVLGDRMDGSGSSADLVLIGVGGADTLLGGSGNDFVYFDATDSIAGGAGNDWAVAFVGSAAIALNMAATAFENAWGSELGDAITAAGAASAAVVVGAAGNDTLTGGNAADWLYGFADADVLDGGAGNDNLVGGAGNDIFRFSSPNWGVDIIWDFAAGQDRIALAGTGLSGFGQLAISQIDVAGFGPSSIISSGNNQIWVLGSAALAASDFTF